MLDMDIRLVFATALGVSLLARVGGTAAGGLIGALGARLLILFVDIYLPHLHFTDSDRESSRFLRVSLILGLGSVLSHAIVG